MAAGAGRRGLELAAGQRASAGGGFLVVVFIAVLVIVLVVELAVLLAVLLVVVRVLVDGCGAAAA
jgi:hypothetical protein